MPGTTETLPSVAADAEAAAPLSGGCAFDAADAGAPFVVDAALATCEPELAGVVMGVWLGGVVVGVWLPGARRPGAGLAVAGLAVAGLAVAGLAVAGLAGAGLAVAGLAGAGLAV